MRRTRSALCFLTAVLTVWCLGCTAFEAIAKSLLESRASAGVAISVAEISTAQDARSSLTRASVGADIDAADACHCALGHAAVVSVAFTLCGPTHALADFVERPPAVALPAPEPLLRPPVA